MRQSASRAILVLLFVGAVDTRAEEVRTAPVSPGNRSNLVTIEARCPTFSWRAVPDARGYELVVYRVGDGSDEARPVLQESFEGSIHTWTPALARCLDRGAQYAWSARTLRGERAGDWSTPNLFRVAAGPSEADLEQALEVVRRHFGASAAVAEPLAAVAPETATNAPGAPSGEPPSPLRAPSGTQMSVDGNLDATSFSGDGALVTNLDPANLAGVVPVATGGTGATNPAIARSMLGAAAHNDLINHALFSSAHHSKPTTLPPSGAAGGDLTGVYPNPQLATGSVGTGEIADGSIRPQDLIFEVATEASVAALQDRFDCPGAAFNSGGRFVDCGNGTIRDMNTGTIWLKDANCADLPATDRNSARDAVAGLKSGMCGLTDGSLPGQWRLSTIGELCSDDTTPSAGICPATASGDSLINTNFSAPTLSDSAGTGQWSASGDPFISVTGTYWSTTRTVEGFWHVELVGGDVQPSPSGSETRASWPVRGNP